MITTRRARVRRPQAHDRPGGRPVGRHKLSRRLSRCPVDPLVVHIRSAEDGHSSIQQGAGNQWCSQTTGADKNTLKTTAAYTTDAGTPIVFRRYEDG